MRRIRVVRMSAAAGLLAVPLLFSGCSLTGETGGRQIDPPLSVWTEEAGELGVPHTGGSFSRLQAAVAEADEMTPLTVYVKERGGYIAPVSVPSSGGSAEEDGIRALEMMIDGSGAASVLPEGFRGILPAGTRIEGFTIDREQRIAVVDFTGSFTDYNPQDERKILEAIAWTLTGLPDVEGVLIHHDGERLSEMPVDGYPLDGPLTRAMGINLEIAPGVDYVTSMPVTVYFSALSDDGDPYFVPVTRLIERKHDRATAALRELIAGPASGAELNGVMTEDVEALAVTLDDGTAVVELHDAAYDEGQMLPAEMLQAVVLSVTENVDAEKVSIRVNGSKNIIDTDNRSYAEPVARPGLVNMLRT